MRLPQWADRLMAVGFAAHAATEMTPQMQELVHNGMLYAVGLIGHDELLPAGKSYGWDAGWVGHTAACAVGRKAAEPCDAMTCTAAFNAAAEQERQHQAETRELVQTYLEAYGWPERCPEAIAATAKREVQAGTRYWAPWREAGK